MKRRRIDQFFARAFELPPLQVPPPADVLVFWNDLLPELRPLVRARLDIRSRTRLARTCRTALAEEDNGRALSFPSAWIEKIGDEIGINRHLIPTFLRALFELGWHRWPSVEQVTTPVVDCEYPPAQDIVARGVWITFDANGACRGHCGHYPFFIFRLRHNGQRVLSISARWSTHNTLGNRLEVYARETWRSKERESLHNMRIIPRTDAEEAIRQMGIKYEEARAAEAAELTLT